MVNFDWLCKWQLFKGQVWLASVSLCPLKGPIWLAIRNACYFLFDCWNLLVFNQDLVKIFSFFAASFLRCSTHNIWRIQGNICNVCNHFEKLILLLDLCCWNIKHECFVLYWSDIECILYLLTSTGHKHWMRFALNIANTEVSLYDNRTLNGSLKVFC